ncbi:flagellar transcriptional regulator FlhD [Microbulbifer elongatus]
MQDSAINEIQEINLSYLLLAQRLLKEDFATAPFERRLCYSAFSPKGR